MKLFEKIKDVKIKRLEARIEELEIYEDLYKRLNDNYIQKIIGFMSPESLLFYLRKRAELNIKMANLIGPYENSFPKDLDESTVRLMKEVDRLTKRFESDLEGSVVFFESDRRETPPNQRGER